MDFLKKLNEEYRLFYIDPEDHSIEEVDLEDILDQGPPEGYEDEHGDEGDEQPEDDVDSEFEPESDEDDIDFSQFDDPSEKVYEPEPIPDEDDGEDADLDYDNVDDLGHGMDGFQNPETKGEQKLDPNLTGLDPLKDEDPEDPSSYDDKQYHYPAVDSEHLSNKNTNNMSVSDDAYASNDDNQDEEGFDKDEDYSDILGDMNLGSYLAKFAGHAQPESEDGSGDGDIPDEDSMDQPAEDGEEGLEGEDQDDDGTEEDDQYQGVIRQVAGAYLISKKQQPDSLFKEIWVYNVGDDVKTANTIRRAILAGTDINPATEQSSDQDSQETCETSTIGNVQFLTINGMTN